MVRLDGGAARGLQSGRLTISVNGANQIVDEAESASMPNAAANVAGMYTALRDDIIHSTSSVADFGHAAKLTQLITDVFASSLAGKRCLSDDWPEE